MRCKRVVVGVLEPYVLRSHDPRYRYVADIR
jgi:hypothetical protein